MKFNYLMPTQMYFGKDAVLNNKEVFSTIGTKALIVTGRSSAKKNGSYDDIRRALEANDIAYHLFDEVEENPSLETIEKGSQMGKENKVDFVIGIGGGSPMDAAKAMAVFIKNPQINKDNIFEAKALDSLPVVAVATTSGTGSEMTQYSIVTSDKEETKKNLGQSVFPKLSFLDSKYTYDLPDHITINTSIDAFTHLLEGYLNTNSTVMSDIYGEKGLQLFESCFKKLVSHDLDHEFRDNVMLASALAGIQIAQSGTSLPHGMGYPLTYFKGMPHGLANGVLTVAYLRTFKDQTKINKVLELLGMTSLDQLEAVFDQLIDVEIDITAEEIEAYSKDFFSNKGKLENHLEEVTLDDIREIYTSSLLK